MHFARAEVNIFGNFLGLNISGLAVSRLATVLEWQTSDDEKKLRIYSLRMNENETAPDDPPMCGADMLIFRGSVSPDTDSF
jgi:hypothetical protein